MASLGSLQSRIRDREERKQYQSHIRGFNAYDRHKKFIDDYCTSFMGFYGKDKSSQYSRPVKTDLDTLREGYRFIRTEEDDKDPLWEQRLVKRYYDKLFKEWRTEKEIISGKGQFLCGNKHCDDSDTLGSYEVNFSYFEAGESKQALVKLVACQRCADKLNYRKRKEKEQLEKQMKHVRKRKREQSDSDDRDNEDKRTK